MGGVRVTPEQATSKWVSRLGAATQEIAQGVANVTTAPGTLAAAKKDKWFARIQESQAKWARNVAAVSLSEWQQAMTQIGIPRVSQGAQQKQGKYQKFAESFFPYLEAGVRQVRAMSDLTAEDRINRAVAMMRYNAGYKRPTTAA